MKLRFTVVITIIIIIIISAIVSVKPGANGKEGKTDADTRKENHGQDEIIP